MGCREQSDWLAYRGEAEVEDLERAVLFDDVAPALLLLKEKANRTSLLLGLLR